MRAFHSGREAKEFLVSKIIAVAQRENVALSEVERKMLYFTESGWTIPGIAEVSEQFDREYNQAGYERKIAGLIRKADKHIRKGSREEYDKWWSSIRFLQREDHYILVMVRLAGLRPRGDQLRLFATGLGIALIALAWIFLSIRYNIPTPSRGNLSIAVWAVLASLFVVYTVLGSILGREKTEDLTSKAIEKLVRIYQRVSGTT